MPSNRHNSGLSILENWCASNCIYLGKKICLRGDSQSGIGVFSKEEAVEPQSTLVQISKSSILSAKSCSLSGVISTAPYGYAAQLSLSLALYGEILKGTDSRWHGYLQSLPPGIVDLPIFWDLQPKMPWEVPGTNAITASVCLAGTEGGRLRDRILDSKRTVLNEINYFYHEFAEQTLKRHAAFFTDDKNPSLQDFYRAFSLVSSRAFLVDAYHGLAMVPIADVFNHVAENHVHLESDYNVCPECGSLYECLHDRDDPNTHNTELPDLHTVSDDDGFYEMVSNTEIPPNTEIFNTYGEELTNAELLNQYGFLLDVNDNDRLSWDLDDILGTLTTPGSLLQSSQDEFIDELGRILMKLPKGGDAFSNFQLIFLEPSKTHFCLNSDGAMSHHLWALLFTLSARKHGLRGTQFEITGLVSAVLALHLDLETAENDDENDADASSAMEEDESTSTEPTQPEELALLILLNMCHLVVRLCSSRKINSGPKGYTDEQLHGILDSESANSVEGKRVKLAISLLIGERSILDACAAGWTALIDSIAAVSHT